MTRLQPVRFHWCCAMAAFKTVMRVFPYSHTCKQPREVCPGTHDYTNTIGTTTTNTRMLSVVMGMLGIVGGF